MANPIDGHPYPNLQIWPTSGLTFQWAEAESFDMSAGPDGVRLGMVMIVYWSEFMDPLVNGIGQLLGYSKRVPNGSGTGSTISRMLPWQHPRYNQLFVKRIARVQGKRIEELLLLEEDHGKLQSLGPGGLSVIGPAMEFNLLYLTLEFWRPPYTLRTDANIQVNGGKEYLRYVDKHWTIQTQILAKEGSQMEWSPTYAPTTNAIDSPMGQPVSHSKVSRRWYEIPEQCLFQTISDGTPNGLPYNLLYTQTQTTNPITNYDYPVDSPLPFCVNSPIGGGTDDSNADNRFFGCYMGTLRFDGVEIVTRDLQMPPALMEIAGLVGNEAVSQVQYDVVFHFDLFDPPRGYKNGTLQPFRGHNLAPYAGDGLWYPAQYQITPNGLATYTTLLQYADFSDLFKTL
ncbi:MAG: hypothetical protein KGL39_40655 [Patescibacteria group bacterium]|nr:hypothetical protein [Patescibacteria group bacterium]